MHIDMQALQPLGQVASALGPLLGSVYLLINRSRITTWFKRRDQLIAERNTAIEQARSAIAHAESSAAATRDYKDSVDALRVQIDDARSRLNVLEKGVPLTEAFIAWVPKVLEYVVWIEKLAKKANLDLGGRQMPVLPRVLVDHFAPRDSP